MAARKRKYQTDQTREKIKTTQLVNRLQAFVLGPENPTDVTVMLSQSQIKAIEILLSKTLPALTSADITQYHDEPRTAEEIRAEMIRVYGEPITKLLLNEITPEQYALLQTKPKPIEIQGNDTLN